MVIAMREREAIKRMFNRSFVEQPSRLEALDSKGITRRFALFTSPSCGFKADSKKVKFSCFTTFSNKLIYAK